MRSESLAMDNGFERSACALATLDVHGVILRANKKFCVWLGYNRDEIEGLPFERHLTMGGRVFRQTHWSPLMQMQGAVSELKLSLVHRDGRRLPVLINSQRYHQSGDTQDELAIMLVAERHSYERQLLAAQKIATQALEDIQSEQAGRIVVEERLRLMNMELTQANRFKDDFLATLAHELRNPLAPMRNAAEILKKTNASDERQARLAGILDRQLAHMTRLVDDLSDISRISQGKIELRRSLINLNDLVSTAVEAVRPNMKAATHEFVLEISNKTLYLYADPTRILQTIQNLLNNSVKYTPTGGKIWLTVTRDRDEVCLSVRDTGIGIAPSELGSVFGMFSQLTPALDRSQGGLGIGLALVRAFVEIHGGSVFASSAGPGLGSEFILRLPLTERQTDIQSAVPASRVLTIVQRRVLIVDDNNDSAESLKMIVEMDGHEVLTCADGRTALEQAIKFRPDIVLLDIGLPDINGYEVAKRLRTQLIYRPIVLVAITGWGGEQDKQAATAAGFDYHFVKPVDLGALTTLLAR